MIEGRGGSYDNLKATCNWVKPNLLLSAPTLMYLSHQNLYGKHHDCDDKCKGNWVNLQRSPFAFPNHNSSNIALHCTAYSLLHCYYPMSHCTREQKCIPEFAPDQTVLHSWQLNSWLSKKLHLCIALTCSNSNSSGGRRRRRRRRRSRRSRRRDCDLGENCKMHRCCIATST